MLKIMRKNDIKTIEQAMVSEITVVSVPDWNGGYYPQVREGNLYPSDLADYEYIEAEYKNPDDIYHHMDDKFNGHVEPYHEGTYDYTVSLRDLLLHEIIY
jgi:hypothetical protein